MGSHGRFHLGRATITAILTAWFAVLMVDPGMVHRCGMHAGIGHDATMQHSSLHGTHAGHQKPRRESACTCPGACYCVTGQTGPAISTAAPSAQLIPTQVRRLRAAPAVLPLLVDHLRPFSTAPPLSRAA